MAALSTLLRASGAYVIAQILTGVQLGVFVAVGVLVWDWGPGTIAAVMPFGLALVAIQMPLLMRVLPGGGGLKVAS